MDNEKTPVDRTMILKEITNPEQGLPEDIFLEVSRISAMVNIDLLVKSLDGKRTLLSWRDDEYCGKGWHVPGGIVRVTESLSHRIQQVINTEIFGFVKFNGIPIDIHEIIRPEEKYRRHFVSILYQGFMDDGYPLMNSNKKETDAGFLKWFDKCPDDLLHLHEIYRKYI